MFAMPGQLERRKHIKHVEDMGKLEVRALEEKTRIDRQVLWAEDFLGEAGEGDYVVPGPLRKLKEGGIYHIDPRKRQ